MESMETPVDSCQIISVGEWLSLSQLLVIAKVFETDITTSSDCVVVSAGDLSQLLMKIVKQTTGVLNFFVAMFFQGAGDVLFDGIKLVIIQAFIRHDLENGGFFRVLNGFLEGTYFVAEHQFDFSLDRDFIVVESCVRQQHKRGLNNLHWGVVLFYSFGLLFALFLFNLLLGQGKVLRHSHDGRMLEDHAIFWVDCLQIGKIFLEQNKYIV